jgi:hypothetical protein
MRMRQLVGLPAAAAHGASRPDPDGPGRLTNWARRTAGRERRRRSPGGHACACKLIGARQHRRDIVGGECSRGARLTANLGVIFLARRRRARNTIAPSAAAVVCAWRARAAPPVSLLVTYRWLAGASRASSARPSAARPARTPSSGRRHPKISREFSDGAPRIRLSRGTCNADAAGRTPAARPTTRARSRTRAAEQTMEAPTR